VAAIAAHKLLLTPTIQRERMSAKVHVSKSTWKFGIDSRQFGAESDNAPRRNKPFKRIEVRSEEARAHIEAARRHAGEHDQSETAHHRHHVDDEVGVRRRNGIVGNFRSAIHFLPLDKKLHEIPGAKASCELFMQACGTSLTQRKLNKAIRGCLVAEFPFTAR
jgi:hypothetical protein